MIIFLIPKILPCCLRESGSSLNGQGGRRQPFGSDSLLCQGHTQEAKESIAAAAVETNETENHPKVSAATSTGGGANVRLLKVAANQREKERGLFFTGHWSQSQSSSGATPMASETSERAMQAAGHQPPLAASLTAQN